MFRASLVHHQAMQLYRTIAKLYYHIQYMALWWDPSVYDTGLFVSYIDDLTTVSYIEDDSML